MRMRDVIVLFMIYSLLCVEADDDTSMVLNFEIIYHFQASLSLPGSPFNVRRSSRGSHQFTIRNGRSRFVGQAGSDRKPLVLSTYLDAQEHLPYADDSNAVTPMSEENGTMVVPVYYASLGSRHSSYTSHASKLSYTSHVDLFGGLTNAGKPMTKESQLKSRSAKAPSLNGHMMDSTQKHLHVTTNFHTFLLPSF